MNYLWFTHGPPVPGALWIPCRFANRSSPRWGRLVPTSSAPRAALRAQLIALAHLLPPLGDDGPLVVIVARGSTRLRFEFSPDELLTVHSDLSPIEQAILAVVTDQPQSAKTIARLAGYKPISITRALTALCRKRLVLRTPDGYCRTPDAK